MLVPATLMVVYRYTAVLAWCLWYCSALPPYRVGRCWDV
jgi:hypothetical protein